MCDVCGYQKWDSPKSNMKFQWSIQLRHTKIELGRVTYLNYRNMHIWPLTKLDNITLKLFIWLYIHHIIWFFWIKTSHCEIDARNFQYFKLMSKYLAFWASYIFIKVAFPFSQSNTSMCEGFCSSLSLLIWDLNLLNSF